MTKKMKSNNETHFESIQDYIKQVNEQFMSGNATEHSYRPMLQQLLSNMLQGFMVINEPARISCGAPDLIITRKNMPVFFIETKDIGDNDLDGRKRNKEQFDRYKASLNHIIFTDYLDFHLYENGEWISNIRIAETQGNKIVLLENKVQDFKALVDHIAITNPKPIKSAQKLAEQMAAKARLLSDIIKEAFKKTKDDSNAVQQNKQLQNQLDAFRRVLIHDLTPDAFADIYAQTVAYGMFTARLHDDTPEDFSRQKAATLIPKSNPFLRQIFQSIAGYEIDERIAWVVDDLVNIFLATDIKKVMNVYSGKKIHHDPMIHFYEDFLSAYNPELRKAKGVWYTPQPVVQFIVRAVEEILQRDFGLTEGLADHSMIEHEVPNQAYTPEKSKKKELPKTIKSKMHRVQILDPATGTGTFLAETVNQIYDKFRGKQGMWQGYVTDHLLPRLHGFEILMASYAVAHLKLDMLLQETGFEQPANQKRLKIYLTNSLEECYPYTDTIWASWLSNEANEANHIKRDCPVMVMMGNPPYSGISQNHGEWIMKLIGDYKFEPNSRTPLQERKTWLDDDYVKFMRLAHYYISRNGEGVMAFINNNGFIDNPTFRGMRWSLLETFDEIYILNLHGNSMKKETALDGSKDENVFDIMVGVSINIFVKTGKKKTGEIAKVFYKDVYGCRDLKYEFLTNTSFSNTDFKEVELSEPFYFFCPKNDEGKEKYEKGVKVDELIITNVSGIVTARDGLVIDQNKASLLQRINDFCDLSKYDEEIRQKYFGNKKDGKYKAGDSRGWSLSTARRTIQQYNHANLIRPILYRPFDTEFIYYSKDMVDWGREQIMCHLIDHSNCALVVSRQCVSDWKYVFVTNGLCNFNLTATAGRLGSGYVFPLYLYVDNFGTEEKIPNLKPEEWKKFSDAVGRETTPEELLAYIYAVLHSPTYRERYKEFLKIDFPRIPLPASAEEFERLGILGQQLIDLHLMRNTQTWHCDTTFPESGDNKVEQYNYADGKVWINDTQYFGGVPETAWNFYIGGYQPAQKWLKDRKGRTMTFDDINHYLHIIYALTKTQRLMKEIG